MVSQSFRPDGGLALGGSSEKYKTRMYMLGLGSMPMLTSTLRTATGLELALLTRFRGIAAYQHLDLLFVGISPL